jgi:hypothetical protein
MNSARFRTHAKAEADSSMKYAVDATGGAEAMANYIRAGLQCRRRQHIAAASLEPAFAVNCV